MSDLQKLNLLPVPVGRNYDIQIAQTVEDQVELLSQKTPKKFVKKRKGRGGMVFDYVEVNYVVGILNAIFRYDWDIDVIEKVVDEKNRSISLLCKLTVRFADGKAISKTGWGGSDIKYTRGSPSSKLDFANDFKSAQSDGLKKCASMLGVAWDVYSGITKSKDPNPSGNGGEYINGEVIREDTRSRTDRGTTDPRESEQSFDNEEAEDQGDPNDRFKFDFKKKGKTIRVTKYDVLKFFQEAKKNIGDKIYYSILGSHGFEKSNQIPMEKSQEVYDAMVQAFKDMPKKEEK